MLEYRTKLQDGGRLVVPVSCRRALSLDVGDDVVLKVHDGELVVYPARHALSRARELVKKHTRKKDLVKDLIADRRREAKHD